MRGKGNFIFCIIFETLFLRTGKSFLISLTCLSLQFPKNYFPSIYHLLLCQLFYTSQTPESSSFKKQNQALCFIPVIYKLRTLRQKANTDYIVNLTSASVYNVRSYLKKSKKYANIKINRIFIAIFHIYEEFMIQSGLDEINYIRVFLISDQRQLIYTNEAQHCQLYFFCVQLIYNEGLAFYFFKFIALIT